MTTNQHSDLTVVSYESWVIVGVMVRSRFYCTSARSRVKVVFWSKSPCLWILHTGLTIWDEISLEKFQESRVPIPCQDQLLCNWRPFYLGIITCISGFTEAEMLNYSSAQICSLHQDNLELVIKNINTSNCNKLNTNIISLLYTHYTDIPKELSLNPSDSPGSGCWLLNAAAPSYPLQLQPVGTVRILWCCKSQIFWDDISVFMVLITWYNLARTCYITVTIIDIMADQG